MITAAPAPRSGAPPERITAPGHLPQQQASYDLAELVFDEYRRYLYKKRAERKKELLDGLAASAAKNFDEVGFEGVRWEWTGVWVGGRGGGGRVVGIG